MDNRLLTDEKTIRRVPSIIILIYIFLLALPAIAPTWFESQAVSVFTNPVQSQHAHFYLHLLQGSVFTLSIITLLLAFIQFKLTSDRIALVIGLSLLFSVAIEILHIVFFDTLSHIQPNYIRETLLWIFMASLSGLIFIGGLMIVMRNPLKISFPLTLLVLMTILFMGLVISSVHYFGFFIKSLDKGFLYSLDEFYIAIYFVVILLIYPRIYKKYPTILSNCIFYMAVAEIMMASYFLVFIHYEYSNIYMTYYFQILVFAIPFTCLITNYIFTFNAIVDAKKNLQSSQEKLKFVAAHDDLTGLYNRREFEVLLNRNIVNCSREFKRFALFLIDLDNFKLINDSLGHLHGDHFLKQFSEQLIKITRKGDVLSRVGGDEFTIITPSLKSTSAARVLAERIIKGLNTAYPVNEKMLTGTVSVGISIYPNDGESAEELLKNADIAMYDAKKSGKNTYRFHTEKIHEAQNRESEIESHLRQALFNNELSLHYQPQYNLVTMEIIGAEILLRWDSDVLGSVSPVEFIPVAENSSLIITLGNWVLAQACEQTKKWLDKYQKPLAFSINVSPIQFENNSFFHNFKTTLEKFKYPAHSLSIEITENLIMKNNEVVSFGLKQIYALGTQISLDDFGVGYSSLSRLQLFPISTIKIDKSFVATIQNSDDKIVVVDTIIKLAHELGMTIIAEGIETQAQLDYLILRKCTMGQGFYMSKPIPAKAFEKLAYVKNNKT